MAEENVLLTKSGIDGADSSVALYAQEAQKLYEAGYDAAHIEDHAQAMAFYRQAAHMGHRQSLSEMFQIYDIGRGVEPDAAEASLWLQRFQQVSDLTEPNHIYWLLLAQYDLWPIEESQPFFERSPAETFEVLRLLLKQEPSSELVSVSMEYFFRGGKLKNEGAQLYLDYGDDVRLDIVSPQDPISMARAFYIAQRSMTRAINPGYRGNWGEYVGSFDIRADEAGASLHFPDDSIIVLRPPASQMAKTSRGVLKLLFGGGKG